MVIVTTQIYGQDSIDGQATWWGIKSHACTQVATTFSSLMHWNMPNCEQLIVTMQEFMEHWLTNATCFTNWPNDQILIDPNFVLWLVQSFLESINTTYCTCALIKVILNQPFRP